MHPVNFDGAVEIKKPDNMTDEECISVWAKRGFLTLYGLLNGTFPLPPCVLAGIDDNTPFM